MKMPFGKSDHHPQKAPATRNFKHKRIPHLDRRLVCYRRHGLGLVVLGADGAGLPRLHRLSLQVDVHTLLLGLSLLGRVLLDTVEELLSRARVADVLDADVDALLDVAVADLSVQDDTDGGFGDVVDNAGLSVVDLVRL